jgi:flagellar basal-body rod modification protein FlgD
MQIFANPITAAPFAAQDPADSTTQSSSGNSDSNSATITANDFLQLLVTEMQNQDPTADTDPNQYINQLVQVNSLEQLISINQDLSGLSSSSPGGTGDAVSAGQSQSSTAPSIAAGNLSATDTGGRASRIADALGTAAQTLAPGSAQSPLNNAVRSFRDRTQQAHTIIANPAH